jgi:aryl-alcohol dehydrogenase-like predicted oxidoreductase
MKYRLFGRSSGLRVSEISLGCGMFGTTWGHGAPPLEARRMFEGYVEAGGNFFDTADTYQRGESERLLGEFVAGSRDDLVIATKFTHGSGDALTVSTTGNSRKNMVRSVEQSLRRLKTDYIDLYWVRAPDGVTPIEEIMRGFDDLVRAGKILYAGLSNFAAWRVSSSATLAEIRGWAPLVGVQVEYSLVERSVDRDILPMTDAHGLGVAGWSPLAGGLLTGKYRRGETGRVNTWKTLFHLEDSERTTRTLDALVGVAKELDATEGQVALAWVSAKGVVPIIGPRTRAQLVDNLAAANVRLSADQVKRLDEVSAIPLGYPHDFFDRFPGTRAGLSAGAEVVGTNAVTVR